MGKGSGPYRVTALQPDLDTRDLFAQLMKEAERGDILGAVVVALRRHKDHQPHYTLMLAGHASSRVTYACGAVFACQGMMHDLALKQAGLK